MIPAQNQVGDDFAAGYKYGFSTPEKSLVKSAKGLSEDVVRQISAAKNEPSWMLNYRLKALQTFYKMPMPMRMQLRLRMQ